MSYHPHSRLAMALLIEWFVRQIGQYDALGAPTPQSIHAAEQVRLYMGDELLVFIRYQANLPTEAATLLVRDLLDDTLEHLQDQPTGRLFYYWVYERASQKMQSRYIYHRFPQDSTHREFRHQTYRSKSKSPRRSPNTPPSSEQENLTLYLLHLLPLRQCQMLLLQDRLDFSEEDLMRVFGVGKNAIRQTLAIARCRFRMMYLWTKHSSTHI